MCWESAHTCTTPPCTNSIHTTHIDTVHTWTTHTCTHSTRYSHAHSCICMQARTHTRAHTRTHTQSTHARTHTHKHTRAHTHIHMRMCALHWVLSTLDKNPRTHLQCEVELKGAPVCLSLGDAGPPLRVGDAPCALSFPARPHVDGWRGPSGEAPCILEPQEHLVPSGSGCTAAAGSASDFQECQGDPLGQVPSKVIQASELTKAGGQ